MKKKGHHKAQKIVPDFDLWVHVARTISPGREPEMAAGTKTPDTSRAKSGRKPKGKNNQPDQRWPKVVSQPDFTGIHRRDRQRLGRGNVKIEARIDLHGETLETARYKLLQFLQRACTSRLKLVLVITGKGSSPYFRHTLHGQNYQHSNMHDGLLRKALPEWLHDPQFRQLVSGFQPAHPRHGGGGAYYIRLRKPSMREFR